MYQRTLKARGTTSFLARTMALCAALLWTPVEAQVSQSRTFHYTGTLQRFTVPPNVTTLTIRATGARGGTAYDNTLAGLGATVQGDFAVTPGAQFSVLVGGMGLPGYNGGGGGGSFIWKGLEPATQDALVLAAGGGGGAGCNRHRGIDAVVTVSGMSGNGSPGALGGRESAGGGGGFAGFLGGGGGGGGFALPGNAGGAGLGTPGGEGGMSIGAGGQGGKGMLNGDGGFGGGGGAAGAAGGGGGYGGGGAGGALTDCGGGGGGGSFNAGTNPRYAAASGYGHGQVTFSWRLERPVVRTFHDTGAPQHFVVPEGVTRVTFTAVGARGGSAYDNGSAGLGASMQGDFAVTPGMESTLLVGGAGLNGTNGGGGGGSFVWRGQGTGEPAALILAAGGGGGAGCNGHNGVDASLTPNGTAGNGSPGAPGGEATRGGGGGARGYLGGAGGGAGLAHAGARGEDGNGSPGGGGGAAIIAGGQGGTGSSGGDGGFGGGGGAAGAGGGGGGYGGGGGGGAATACGGGGGGGSFNAGEHPVNISAAGAGPGTVVVQYLEPW